MPHLEIVVDEDGGKALAAAAEIGGAVAAVGTLGGTAAALGCRFAAGLFVFFFDTLGGISQIVSTVVDTWGLLVSYVSVIQ